MNFYLTNEHRKYMGLKPIKENYDLVKIKKGKSKEFYLFFDENRIVKVIDYEMSDKEIGMHEADVDYKTNSERTIVLPKTNRGKERKLIGSVVESFDGIGCYFSIWKRTEYEYGTAIIGNYTTQKTFYEDCYIEKCSTLADIEAWCNKYIAESTEQDLKEVKAFATEKRVHCSFKEGDYFRVKLGRNKYTYGRILLDIYKGTKNKTLDYYHMMGRALIIEVFHILTDRKDVTIEELKRLKTFPSQHILDTRFYYGDYEIIGNDRLPEQISYPIIYCRSVSMEDCDNIIFQCGPIHFETRYDEKNFFGQFKNIGLGFAIAQDERLIEKCLNAGSNKPYWGERPHYSKIDLRAPVNRDIRIKVFKQFGLDDLIEFYTE